MTQKDYYTKSWLNISTSLVRSRRDNSAIIPSSVTTSAFESNFDEMKEMRFWRKFKGFFSAHEKAWSLKSCEEFINSYFPTPIKEKIKKIKEKFKPKIVPSSSPFPYCFEFKIDESLIFCEPRKLKTNKAIFSAKLLKDSASIGYWTYNPGQNCCDTV